MTLLPVEQAAPAAGSRPTGRRPAEQRLLLIVASITVLAWAAFALWIPLVVWAERPTPHQEIAAAAPRLGPVTLPMALLALLVSGYAGLALVAWRGRDDLPPWLAVGTFVLSGLGATLTYPSFASDVYVVLANVWSLAFAGENPYAVVPALTRVGSTVNPYVVYTGNWAALEYVYGPVWLVIGGAIMRLVGPGIVVNVLLTKLLMWGCLALLGWLVARLARARGDGKPMAAAALVWWNPLLLTDGVMTPHLDLPMAAALLAAIVAWREHHEGDMVAGLALSIGLKWITALLVPAVLLALAVRGAFRGLRGRALLAVTVAVGLLGGVALWPGVWDPFLRHGLPASLDLISGPALVPNLVRALHALGLLLALDANAAAQTVRWVAFVPLWLWATATCVRLARDRSAALPDALLPAFALLLLVYHVLFTAWVVPWHFATALVLCLAAPGPAASVAALLVTLSGEIYNLNAQWVWAAGVPEPWLSWVLAASLMPGPIFAGGLLARVVVRGLGASAAKV